MKHGTITINLSLIASLQSGFITVLYSKSQEYYAEYGYEKLCRQIVPITILIGPKTHRKLLAWFPNLFHRKCSRSKEEFLTK